MIFVHLAISVWYKNHSLRVYPHQKNVCEKLQSKNPYVYLLYENASEDEFIFFTNGVETIRCTRDDVHSLICLPLIQNARKNRPYINYNICFILQSAESYVFFRELFRENSRMFRMYKLICFTDTQNQHSEYGNEIPCILGTECRLSKASVEKLVYKFNITPDKFPELGYMGMCENILAEGEIREDRTNVGTIGIFGVQLHFDIKETVPLLTTKRVAWRHCIQELLWFLRGDTDARLLQEHGVHIWDQNTSREFLDARGLVDYEEGVLGPGYGWQWRFFGTPYDQKYADTSKIDRNDICSGVDQIEHVIREIQENPFSRRLLVSAWNPCDLKMTALPPCHFGFQFYVEKAVPHEKDDDTRNFLNCHFLMRSNDLGCGFAFNLFSYSVLTYIIAMKCNLRPGRLVYTCSDAHIYMNHVEAMREQLRRTPRPAPKLILSDTIREKSFEDITLEDFQLLGYFPHPPLKMSMAV